jgi:hypothetical protein
MGLLVQHAMGRDLRAFASVQTAYDTAVRPIAAHALRVRSVEFTPENGREDRMDNRPTRSLVSRITTGYSLAWKASSYLRPSGTAGTAPDDFDLWTSAFGTETITAGTSVAYTPSNSQAQRMFSLTRGHLGVLFDSAVGCVVNKMALKVDGPNPPELTWEGFARRRILGAPLTLQTGTTGATWVATNNEGQIAPSVGALYYQVGADNSGAGFRVDAIGAANSGGAGFTNVTAESSHGMSAGSLLLPFLPSETLAGQPVAGIAGSVSWGPITFSRDTMRVVGLDLELDNQSKAHTDEALTRFSADVTLGRRRVTGTLRCRVTSANAIEFVRNYNANFVATYNPIAATVVIGTTAGNIVTISLPRLEVGNVTANAPESDEMIAEIPFVALASAETAADEISVTFT